MLIKDVQGKYELRVDKNRRIVYETNMKMWTKEDFDRFQKDYEEKVIPYLGKSPWSKLVDTRNYIPSTNMTPEMMNAHVTWATNYGYKCYALLVSSVTTKMQVSRCSKDVDNFTSCCFDNEKEADEWLKSQGF